jgi:hypothetical protein
MSSLAYWPHRRSAALEFTASDHRRGLDHRNSAVLAASSPPEENLPNARANCPMMKELAAKSATAIR